MEPWASYPHAQHRSRRARRAREAHDAQGFAPEHGDACRLAARRRTHSLAKTVHSLKQWPRALRSYADIDAFAKVRRRHLGRDRDVARGLADDVRRARHRHADVARRPSPGRRGHVEGGQERGAPSTSVHDCRSCVCFLGASFSTLCSALEMKTCIVFVSSSWSREASGTSPSPAIASLTERSDRKCQRCASCPLICYIG